MYAAPAWIPNALPQSLAADATSLYYLDGTTLWRVGLLPSAPPPAVLTAVVTGADRLQVDAECVYWIEDDGKRIMRRAK